MWEQLVMNGKEFPKNSFEKFTAKTLVNNMKAKNDIALKNYAVTATDRKYNPTGAGMVANEKLLGAGMRRGFVLPWLVSGWSLMFFEIVNYAPASEVGVLTDL